MYFECHIQVIKNQRTKRQVHHTRSELIAYISETPLHRRTNKYRGIHFIARRFLTSHSVYLFYPYVFCVIVFPAHHTFDEITKPCNRYQILTCLQGSGKVILFGLILIWVPTSSPRKSPCFCFRLLVEVFIFRP